jgi:insertion element IS1 protein InsB
LVVVVLWYILLIINSYIFDYFEVGRYINSCPTFFMPDNKRLNQENDPLCYSKVGECPFCKQDAIKYGFSKCGKQRFQCKSCRKTFIGSYTRNTIGQHTSDQIKMLLKEGCGIRSIGRLLGISATSVLRKIAIISASVGEPLIKENQVFEMDELYSFVGSKAKKIWIIYAINRSTGEVAGFSVGCRSISVLSLVTFPLIQSCPIVIHTDKLVQYKSIIPQNLHSTKNNSTNHIERKNLTLRTHLKRLSRRTICFSKSATMLAACLKIYFWG